MLFRSVDIEPTIFEFIRAHFDADWMADKRVTLIREDGRNYLMHTDSQYDVISLELGQLHRPGVAFFYTVDFYRHARKRLKPGGFLVQFVPLQFLTTDLFRGVVRTFLAVFPQSSLWYNRTELLLIGVNDDRFKLSQTSLERLSSNALVHQDLSMSDWGGPAFWLNRPQVFLGSYLMGPDGLTHLAAGGRLYRDELPVLDYAASQLLDSEWNEIAILPVLREHLESVEKQVDFELSTEAIAAISDIREKNLNSIEIRRLIRQAKTLNPSKDEEQLITLLLQAGRLNRDDLMVTEMLWKTLMNRHRYEDMRAYYAETVQLRPQDALAHFRLAIALHNLRRLDEALAHYQTALQLRPADAEIHNSTGVAFAQRGDLARALQHLEKAVQLRPKLHGGSTKPG